MLSTCDVSAVELTGGVNTVDTKMFSRKRIYCAGPLFNESEKQEMKRLAEALESASYGTFLPHRDGLEFSQAAKCLQKKGIPSALVNSVLSRAIFALDVFQVVNCHGLVLNMNGRVPDEGAMVEAGIAWANNKKIVIFKNDARTLLNGSDNPLVLGLSNFCATDSCEGVTARFNELFADDTDVPVTTSAHDLSFKTMVKKGEEIYSHMAGAPDMEELCQVLLDLFEQESSHAGSYPARQAV